MLSAPPPITFNWNFHEYIHDDCYFFHLGGVIEACPPSDSVTALSVDMFIEPNGKVNIESMGDQIHAETPFSCWGMSVPQSSVEPEALNECCMKVGDACKARGVIGHFTIDFVTFIHPKSVSIPFSYPAIKVIIHTSCLYLHLSVRLFIHTFALVFPPISWE